MRNALDNNIWYCHAFCKIPRVQLVCTITDKGDIEQELIQSAENTNQQMKTTHRQIMLEAKKRGESMYRDLTAKVADVKA